MGELEKATAEDVRPDWMPTKPLLLDQKQTAAYLNISERMVRYLIEKRKLIPKYIGKAKSRRPRCLIPTAQVEKFARKLAGE